MVSQWDLGLITMQTSSILTTTKSDPNGIIILRLTYANQIELIVDNDAARISFISNVHDDEYAHITRLNHNYCCNDDQYCSIGEYQLNL